MDKSPLHYYQLQICPYISWFLHIPLSPTHLPLRFIRSHHVTNMGKTIIHHPVFDGVYHPFMVIWGMVYGIVLGDLGDGLWHCFNMF